MTPALPPPHCNLDVYLPLKRLADFAAALAGLLVLSPLLVPVVVGLRLTGEGEVFYRQRRLGYKRRPFGIYKFATMLKDSPNIGTGDITLRDDPRITPMGGWLRRTKVNELPQLLNVLFGDMSLVGPRPLMPVSFEMYAPAVQAVVYDSRPGVTGIGSLVFRDEEALVTRATELGLDARRYYREAIYPYKGAVESWYRRNRGLWTDTKILAGTALSLVASDVDWAARLFRDLPARPALLDLGRSGEWTLDAECEDLQASG